MKKIILPILLVAVLALPLVARGEAVPSEEATPSVEAVPSVEAAATGTGVEELTPLGVAESFPPSVGKVYCYSKIVNGEGTTILHRWYYKGEVIADVSLAIGSPRYRTYSYKTILPHQTGEWKVEIISEGEDVLKTLDFSIEEQQSPVPDEAQP